MKNYSIKLKRSIAFIIDFVVYGVLWIFILPAIVAVLTPSTLNENTKPLYVFLLIILSLFPMMLRDLHISLGKRIMGIRVYSQNGEKATWKQRLLRNIPIWWLLQVEIILFLVHERRLGDILAKTTVQNEIDGSIPNEKKE